MPDHDAIYAKLAERDHLAAQRYAARHGLLIRQVEDVETEKVFILSPHFPCCGRGVKGLVPDQAPVVRVCKGITGKGKNSPNHPHPPIKWKVTVTESPEASERMKAKIYRAVWEKVEVVS